MNWQILNFKAGPSATGWFLVFLWMGVIFYLSGQPDLKSGLPGEWDFLLRKLAHIAEYFVLTFLVIRALAGGKIATGRILIFAGIIALLYAVSDEIHQFFVFGREGSARDVIIDSVGVTAALIFTKFNLLNRKK